MSYQKTTAFYEMQIRRILEEYSLAEMPSTLRDDLKMLIKNPNSPDFQAWLESNSAEEYK
jgi:hypothetical protein